MAMLNNQMVIGKGHLRLKWPCFALVEACGTRWWATFGDGLAVSFTNQTTNGVFFTPALPPYLVVKLSYVCIYIYIIYIYICIVIIIVIITISIVITIIIVVTIIIVIVVILIIMINITIIYCCYNINLPNYE